MLKRWGSAEAIVFWGEGAWALSDTVFKIARMAGVNPYIIDVVDAVEEAMAGLSLGVIVELRARRLAAGGAGEATPRLAPSKRVTRRLLFGSPITFLLDYTAISVVDSDSCAALPRYDLCTHTCPVDAIKGKPSRIDTRACTECMECVYTRPTLALHPPDLAGRG